MGSYHPPNPQVGYHIAAHSVAANEVYVSHEHPDHNYVAAAQSMEAGGGFMLVNPMTLGTVTSQGMSQSGRSTYERIRAYHDDVGGRKRGPNTITVLTEGGLRVCHLGDLGQLALTPEQVQEIGRVDVLMIPVGGFFTIDGPQAAAIVGQLRPRVILPMHYRTAALNPDLRAKLAPPDAFLAAMRGKASVVHVSARDLKLSPRMLPKTPTIYLLRYQ